MKAQGRNRISLAKQLEKAFQWQAGLFYKHDGFHGDTTLKTLRNGSFEHAGALI